MALAGWFNGRVPGLRALCIGNGKSYAFPLPKEKAQDGKHFVDQKGVPASQQANCATFPATLGVEIPDSSGLLNTYIPALLEWAKTGIRDNRGST